MMTVMRTQTKPPSPAKLSLSEKRAAAGRKGGLKGGRSRSALKGEAARLNGLQGGYWRRFTWPMERWP